jgi:superfamily I DNA/RNA helicase
VTAALAFDEAQRAALDRPLEAHVALTGRAGSGKTTVLLQRALRAAAAGIPTLVTAPSPRTVVRLRERLGDALDRPGIAVATLGQAALAALRAAEPGHTFETIDDARASHVFEAAAARLFSLEWSEIVAAEIDPEITGLRTPQRFAAAAFRLIRKLRRGGISPEAFKQYCDKGATQFYGKTPNLAAPGLIMDTQAKYRDSLRADGAELARQHAREVDLARVLVKLYQSYVRTLTERGCLAGDDAIYQGALALRHPGAPLVFPYRAAFVDDAQDLTAGELTFLRAAFGEELRGVTLAGDPDQATRTFAGARGDAALQTKDAHALTGTYRCAAAVFAAARRGLEPSSTPPLSSDVPNVVVHRASDCDDEARFVAASVARLIAEGTPPERIAVITRSLPAAHVYIDALLARNVPLDVAGDASLYDFPAVQDGLAALWALANPYRHEYVMRNLEAPWLALSDASIAIMCAEPPEQPQPLLFELPEDPEDDSIRARWDKMRDLRLGRNLTRGDVDAALPPDARERVQAFRRALERWESFEREVDLGDLARIVLGETVLAVAGPDARGTFERRLIARLIARIDAYAAREPLGTLRAFLEETDQLATVDADLLSLDEADASGVRVFDVEAAKGLEFDAVFVVDVRAGAFPRYYVPDAFLFTPSLGMIPKENVGEGARSARTAKFTYAQHRLQLRPKYNAEERRAFYCAATRARERLYVSASGRPTKGVAAPEILEELRQRRPNGTA